MGFKGGVLCVAAATAAVGVGAMEDAVAAAGVMVVVVDIASSGGAVVMPGDASVSMAASFLNMSWHVCRPRFFLFDSQIMSNKLAQDPPRIGSSALRPPLRPLSHPWLPGQQKSVDVLGSSEIDMCCTLDHRILVEPLSPVLETR